MLQKKQLEKLEKNTYKARRAEGRTCHGQTSYTIMILGGISWFLLVCIMASTEWRSTWIGVIGYPHQRSWGLFKVSGASSISHAESMTNACRYFSQLTIAGVCSSPICLWYRTKCNVYMDLTFISYATGFGFFLTLIQLTLCLFWTSRLTPRLIRWAAIWWSVQVIMHVSLCAFYLMMTGEVFETLDSQSVYPKPDVSICFFVEVLIIMLLLINAVMSIALMKMWPESSSGSGSSDDSEDSDSDDDDASVPRPGAMGMPQPGAMGMPQPGMMQGQPPMMGAPQPGMMQGQPPMMGAPQQPGMMPGQPPMMQGQAPHPGGFGPPGVGPPAGPPPGSAPF